MRVLLVITQSELGGAQKYVLQVGRALVDAGNEVVLAAGGDGQLLEQASEYGIATVGLHDMIRDVSPARDLRALWSLYGLIRKTKCDIVHCNSTKAGLLGRIAAFAAGVPSVFTVHGLVLSEPMTGLQRLLYTLVEWLVGRISGEIITVSEEDRKAVLRYHLSPPRKVRTVHNGIEDLTQVSSRDVFCLNSVLDHHPAKVVVSVVANFYATKGLTYLMESIALLARDDDCPLFLLVGDGPQRDELDSLIREYGIDAHVLLLGQRSDALEIMHESDFCVLPSVKEGLPFVLLEAMALGKPVVATTVGGIPEVVESGIDGILVPPAAPEPLAEAVRTLASDPQLVQTMGQAAQIKVREHFSLEVMLCRTMEVYEAVLQSRSMRH